MAHAFGLAVVGTARGVEVSTERAVYLPNEPVLVKFRDGPGNLRDWVGLYPENASAGNYTVWQYLDGSQTGVAPLSAGETLFVKGPPREGVYEVRCYENDGYVELASATFEVRNTARLLNLPRMLPPGAALAAGFTNGPGRATDWIGIFPSLPAGSPAVAKVFVDGTAAGTTGRAHGSVPLTTPARTGSFEVRFIDGTSGAVLDATPLDVALARPVVEVTGLADAIELAWAAPIWPVSIGRYVVSSRRPGATDWEAIGTVTAQAGTHRFRHEGRAPGEERCYVVRAEAAGDAAIQSTSEVLCASASTIPDGQHVAFRVPAGAAGSQAWDGALGMEFEVVNPIRVTRLGVFDDAGDGLKRPLTARLYDRTTRAALATLEFSPTAPGTLIGGSRFKDLPAALDLKTGFKGTIVAEGYGPEERAGNRGLKALTLSTHDGGGAVVFGGRGRYGRAGTHPATVDAGPAQRYAAGTFQFQVTAVNSPGKPILTTIPDDTAVLLSWPAVTQPLPAARYQVFRGGSANGTFTQIAEVGAGVTSHRDAGLPNGTEVCYRVRAVGENGVAGPDSDAGCQVPEVVRAGIAYRNPFELEGNQAIGVAVGNDFDVTRPIRITRLGAFDDGSDGLRRTISVRLYERPTQKEFARLTFTPDRPGTLVDGSRFLDLAEPVDLPIGFQGAIVASGYGADERVGNEGIPGTADLNLEWFTGGCLRFVGTSRYGESPDGYPPIADGGPANRYAAGTFAFEPLPLSSPGPAKLSVRLAASGQVEISWDGSGTLEGAPAITGPWSTLGGAVSGIRIQPQDAGRYFRLRREP